MIVFRLMFLGLVVCIVSPVLRYRILSELFIVVCIVSWISCLWMTLGVLTKFSDYRPQE